MSAGTDKRDRAIRSQPGNYVDPARYRGRSGHKKKKRLLSSSSVETPKLSGRLSPRNRKKNLQARAARSGVREVDTSLAPTYTDDEKFALMYLCIRSNVKTVSQQEQIPENTLYGWFRQVGGIDRVREFVASKAEVSFYNLIDETAQEIRHRLKEASNEELFETFREMLSVADKAGIASPERSKKGGGESGGVPGGASIQLIFPGEKPALTQGDPPPPKAGDEDAVEGEFSVFDE